jgi:hypothetical protein
MTTSSTIQVQPGLDIGYQHPIYQKDKQNQLERIQDTKLEQI